MADVFTQGDLVLSVYGNGDGSGTYTDNQASPIVLEQIDPTTGKFVPITGVANGTLVNGMLVLPQQSSGSNSVISGEYGSSSEGSLQLSADGQNLTIAGYGVNAATYNNAEAGYSKTSPGGPYGNGALAQTTSIQGGQYTAVARVIADINASGSVDTSTALYGVDNTNNPRSVVTTDGTSFYLSGQGVSGDTTQGLFYAAKGASSATAIDTSTDTRTVEIYNGQIYVSRNTSQNKQATISSYGGEPTKATSPTSLAGFGPTVTLTSAQANGVDNGRIGSTVYLAPENFFFANATTLYVADDGKPKNGSAGAAGLGDGGLQKWTLANGTWTLQYTLSSGLGLVANTASSGTTGLIGLTGQVVGNTVQLYATNATVGDLDQSYLYSITDTLGATTNPGTSFTQLAAAASGTNIRGVAFAPHTNITVCYCTGTRILTVRGEVAVEHLAIGDIVVTASGARRPIRWIGHRGYIGRFANCNPDILPICVHAGALADGVPARDLWVSPKHALFLDGLLIPAEHLVNGSTVTKATRVEGVEYWHVELDSHDVLLAEGAPAESFVDDNGRGIFHNAHTFHALYPDARRVEAVYCAPRVEHGFALDAVRNRLAARAGLSAAMGLDYGALHGFVERVENGVVHGWAAHAGRPGVPVCLDVLVGGAVVGLALAEQFRADLLAHGVGEGRHGFSFALPAGAMSAVTVRRSADGAALPRLPDAEALAAA